MADGPTTIIQVRICKRHLQEIFNGEDVFAKAERGELLVKEGPVKPRDMTDYRGNHIVGSQELYYSLPSEPKVDIGRAHQYITEQGNIGASGKPDPKEFTIRGFEYRIVRDSPASPYSTCQICAGQHAHPFKV